MLHNVVLNRMHNHRHEPLFPSTSAHKSLKKPANIQSCIQDYKKQRFNARSVLGQARACAKEWGAPKISTHPRSKKRGIDAPKCTWSGLCSPPCAFTSKTAKSVCRVGETTSLVWGLSVFGFSIRLLRMEGNHSSSGLIYSCLVGPKGGDRCSPNVCRKQRIANNVQNPMMELMDKPKIIPKRGYSD